MGIHWEQGRRQSHQLEWSHRDCPAENAVTYRLRSDVVCGKSKPSNRKENGMEGRRKDRERGRQKKREKEKEGDRGREED